MELSYSDTVMLFEIVLGAKADGARELLNIRLKILGCAEPEFCMSVIEHQHLFKYSADQWLDFFLKIPNRNFERDQNLMNKLSENQRQQLRFE